MKPFPEPTSSSLVGRYYTPIILLSAKDGMVSHIDGRPVEVTYTTRVWYSATRESRPVFKVKAPARVPLGGNTVNAILDGGDNLYHGKKYAPTVPTATEYQALIGKEVRTHFECKPVSADLASKLFEALSNEQVFYCSETVTILPKLKDEH